MTQSNVGWRTSQRVLAALLSAAFVVSLGFGVVLPVLPAMVERLTGTSDPATVARHVGLLTAAYVAAPLAVAILWGRLSDSIGRRPILIAGLVGFAATLAATALAPNLAVLYAGRILNGGFAAAVAPTILAFIADIEPDDDRRAQEFAAVGMASIAGFFFGPMLGGFAAGWSAGSSAPGSGPFLLAAGLAAISAACIGTLLSKERAVAEEPNSPEQPGTVPLPGKLRLLLLAVAAAVGLGAFEVGLTLRGGDGAMTSAELAIMFATCSAVMFAVQAIVFSPFVKADATRWLIAPAFAAMALGLALVPGIVTFAGVLATVAVVAASAGLISPLLSYWVAKRSLLSRGVGLGIQSAAVSLGQSVGAAGAGLLFGVNGQENAAFFAAAVIAALAAMASLNLPRQLAQMPADNPSGRRTTVVTKTSRWARPD